LAFKNTSFNIGLNCKKELKRNVNDSSHLLSLISLVKQAAKRFPVKYCPLILIIITSLPILDMLLSENIYFFSPSAYL
jgi:hypothetical protein